MEGERSTAATATDPSGPQHADGRAGGPGSRHRPSGRALLVIAAAGVALAVVAALVVFLHERASYQPLVEGNYEDYGVTAHVIQPPAGSIPPLQPGSNGTAVYRYDPAPFPVEVSVHNAGGWGVTVLGAQLAPQPPFDSPVRQVGPASWTPGDGTPEPASLPRSVPGHGDLNLYVTLRWPTCDVTSYAPGSSLTLNQFVVRYRFLGADHTASVSLDVPLRFPGGNLCPGG